MEIFGLEETETNEEEANNQVSAESSRFLYFSVSLMISAFWNIC